ncbi:MurNAc alpha-1-phosphate uridylyltransferase [Ciceribacter lividus]|uniref:MurNAc alpha-1-phosphate uridylyltransferase n=1 Tax=Ciceribacter lividus TaxID=1197950 RepID=A0A6I7HH73_9HYPH|nr:nucleotidyltransferase family protein [Ciceribacter lividus]RCW20398.1 MurNAc alpha-1-phosphate uridylyltransferase [Ciceribacter lividus]
MKITDAMVLAAGLGTRLRPITDTVPKPLVKVAGKAMIEYALDTLADAGVERVVVNVHHHAEQMIGYLESYPRLQVIISDERAGLMNSGGGLAKGLRLLGDTTVFVMNADLFWIGDRRGHESNLERLADFFDPTRMDMALLCVHPDHTTGHNGKSDFNLDEQGHLTRYNAGDSRPVVYAGAIVMNSSLLNDAPADAFNLNIYFDRAIAKGRLFGLELKGHWITVGTPEAIGEAEDAIRRLQN